MASPCWQGATFPGAVLPAAEDSSGMVRVAGVASLQQCVAACCDLLGYDLAWLFKGRCYALSCQQGASCRPQVRPGADSVLAFLQRVGGEPYGGQEGGPTELGWSQFNQSQEASPGGAEPESNRWSGGTRVVVGSAAAEETVSESL